MKTRKKIAVIAIFAIAVMLLLTSKAQANYQSVGTGSSIYNSADTWIIGIRQMESSGKGMGLSEEVDTTTGLATTDANGVDVHMLKNTEYGATLILGVSEYGKQGESISDRYMNTGATTGAEVQASSTGNKYGVYELGYYSMSTSNKGYEWVAGGETSFLSTIAPRYINRYTKSEDSARAGDATVETKKWHGSGGATWVSSNNGFWRGYNGAFSYNSNITVNTAHARAGMVLAEGI